MSADLRDLTQGADCKMENGGFCLNSQSLHFWVKHIWTLTAKEFSSRHHTKGSVKAHRECTLRVFSIGQYKTPTVSDQPTEHPAGFCHLHWHQARFLKNMLSSLSLTTEV